MSCLPVRLSFWLLIVAWFCANTPQSAAWHAIQWIKNAGHFTHDAQLRVEVAALLTGEKSPDPEHLSVASTSSTTRSLPTETAADVAVKKIPLWDDATDSSVIAPHISAQWLVRSFAPPTSPLEDVPNPPPRGAA